jgi:hypothetical protein
LDDSQTQKAEAATPVPNLALAIRRARIDVAQHSEAVAELRGAETARLEMLGEALKPVLTQVPAHIDLFDIGLTPGEKPRYFIDMLAFVEMGRDRRSYRFLQDTRHGRVTIIESDKPDDIVEAVTAYIARRLVEREQALASDQTIEQAARALVARGAQGIGLPPAAPTPEAPLGAVTPLTAEEAAVATPRRRRGFFATALLFVIELLGSIILFLTLAALGYFLWTVGMHQWALWNQI